jgi:hypothetical protein
MKNTLAYLVAELVTPVKSFIVQAPGLLIEKGSQSELISANTDQKYILFVLIITTTISKTTLSIMLRYA